MIETYPYGELRMPELSTHSTVPAKRVRIKLPKTLTIDTSKDRLVFKLLHLFKDFTAKELVEGTEKTDPNIRHRSAKSKRPVSMSTIYGWRKAAGRKGAIKYPRANTMDRIAQAHGYELDFVTKDN